MLAVPPLRCKLVSVADNVPGTNLHTDMDFERLLERSAAFTDHLLGLLIHIGPLREDLRSVAAASACELSLEHAQALRALLVVGAPNTASAILRLQYEALLRGSWLLYSASEAELARATGEMTLQGQASAQHLPNTREMLDRLVAMLKTQPTLIGLVRPLQEIREQSWKAMNSFVHAGLHPLHRSSEGFPAALADQLVRNSNGMMHMAARLHARLSLGLGAPAATLERAFVGFEDCLPMNPEQRRLEAAT